MITPHKFLDLDGSVISLSAAILGYLSTNPVITYNDLYGWFTSKFGNYYRFQFGTCIAFIFLFGKIEYHKTTDVIEYKP